MGSTSVPADTTAKRRAFSLPSFRKLNGEQRQRPPQQLAAASAAASEEATAAARKAAAWQWHSRGVAETVAPTKASPAAGNGGRPILSGPNSCSRFKAEAIAHAQAKNPIPAKPRPPLPLYDHADLSRLKYRMSSFLQQHHSTQSDGRKLAAIKGECISADRSVAHPPCRPPAAEKHVCISGSTTPVPQNRSLGSVFRAPVSALQSIYRKFLSRPSQPGMYGSPSAEPTSVDQESEAGGIKHHYHRYVHHHHHHYHHYGTAIPNSEDVDETPRIRRFSESAYTRGCSPSPVYGSSDDEIDSEDEETESPDSALSALLRRHSCSSFSEKHKFAEDICNIVAIKLERKIAMENAKKDEQRPPSRHSPDMYSREVLEGILLDKLRQKREDGKGRRRHSMESMREGECMRYSLGSRPLP